MHTNIIIIHTAYTSTWQQLPDQLDVVMDMISKFHWLEWQFSGFQVYVFSH